MPSPRSLVLLALAVSGGCSGGGGGEHQPPPKDAAPPVTAPAPAAKLAEIPRVPYAWDPKAGDRKVSAELGGPGFTGEGWTTADVHQIGDPKAPQGGTMVHVLPDWPPTTRIHGQNWNHFFNYFTVDTVMYEALLDLDWVTYEFVPKLATHWQISEDKTTYRFRINPEARWSDGQPVTSADVVATWKLQMDPTALFPSSILTFGKFEEPKAVSPYIVEVKAKEENWRNFLYFATMAVMPAHEIGKITGKEYLDKYQFSYTAVSGPYVVRPEDIRTGESITLTRRDDWWGEKNPAWDGLYNFAKIQFVVVQDEQLRFEKVKKGEIDYFWVNKSQWWIEDVPKIDEVKRGLLVPRKFFTEAPIGTQGLALNAKVPPLDDLNVRTALQHLFDVELMNKKLFYDEYRPLTSYFQSAAYANPDNPRLPYDELTAVELLEKAGWTEKDGEGYRIRDGRRLKFTVSYSQANSERFLTLFQEACKKAGIQIDLQLLTPATAWKNLQAKQYEIHAQSWGGLTFPNPETSWRSSLAEQVDNNNVTSFANARVDELLVAYDHEYDQAKRERLIQEIDGLIYAEHPYVLGWYSPSQRVLYWNKFGMPEWATGRFRRHDNLFVTWWLDPEKEKALEAARKDAAAKLEAPPVENHYWELWAKARAAIGQGG